MRIKNGYTLIEVLTTIAIFGLVSSSITGLFLSSLNAQRKALNSQKLFDNTSYIMEYMSRALRMAIKDDIDVGGVFKNCLALNNVNYETFNGNQGIRFRNYKANECQEFYLESERLKENKAGIINFLTPEKFKINSIKFWLSGEPQGDGLQPRVTISLDIETTGPKPIAKLQIQTTISQRNLDVTY